MRYVKIDFSNLDIAHDIEKTIFPEYDALRNYLDSTAEDAKGEYYLIKRLGKYIGIVGLYSYDDYPDDAWLGWFGFLEKYRHHGYGKKALAFFENLARERGFKYARLYTDTFNNDEAKEFYKHQGYFEERYLNDNDRASFKYPISIFSKSLSSEKCPLWDNQDIHFSKQVGKQQ